MAEPHTLTFLFTDVEGSTSLWEKHPRRCPKPSSATTRSCVQP